ncbi:hypothetical protein [Halobellus marinus]|uniref:hypothetical protein n=1 Tax=Halobellus TaxID=1073986 RepID=UPI0028A628C7|nr:hypothetical protein [Halobellus sp. DFY28]
MKVKQLNKRSNSQTVKRMLQENEAPKSGPSALEKRIAMGLGTPSNPPPQEEIDLEELIADEIPNLDAIESEE